MNANPRQSNTKNTTHQALCGIPKNSSSQTVKKMEFVRTEKMMRLELNTIWHIDLETQIIREERKMS